MSVTPSTEAIEKAARAMSESWRDMHTNESLGYQRMLATAALTAAAPSIAAQTLLDAAKYLNPTVPDTNWSDAPLVGLTVASCMDWLTARAATLQEEQR